MSAPLVSVVIPTFDGERYVEEALRSALGQTFDDLEVVVVDDGSSDRTLQRAAAAADHRVRIVDGAHAGAAANWNRGVALARGRYVGVLCQDDRLQPGCIAAQVQALQSRDGLVLAAVGRRVVDQGGRVLLPRVRAAVDDRTADRSEVLRRCLARATNALGEPSAVLFDRSAWEVAGGFRPVGYVTDLDMWLRLLELGDAALIAACLADFRVHGRSWSAALRAEQRAATRALLAAAAAEQGLPVQRTLGPRVGGRWLGRSLVFHASRMSRPVRTSTPA